MKLRSTGDEGEIWQATHAFISWLDKHGTESHDPYDIWGTRYGLMARRLYYAKSPLGALLAAPLVVSEVLCPGLIRLFVKKQRFATAEAQLALAFLNLHAVTGQRQHLARAEVLVRGLLDLSIPGYSGHCWGYPFDWQNNRGLWKRHTPFITSTPYCFEAFLAMADATGSEEYLDVAASIARFVAHDLHDSATSVRASAGSYSPIDRTQVVNASAYRAFLLFEASRRFGVEAYRDIAARNLAFVLESQREDGAWLYGLNSPPEAFIDHFHTCFVLKNLVKISRTLESGEIAAAVERGWRYYRSALFHGDDTPRSFAVEPRLQLARVETYNFAEAVTLGCLLDVSVPDALSLARRLATRAIRDCQLADGHFVTRTYLSGVHHTASFLRWPQAQMLLALTNLLRTLDRGKEGCTNHDLGSHAALTSIT